MIYSEHVTIGRRFQRSIRLDSDLGKVDALQGFICQRSSGECLANMASQIANSTQRAFTWTGPYGGGKSSLAVALAGILSPKGSVRTAASEALGATVSKRIHEAFGLRQNGWLVVPVVGRRSNPIVEIGNALEQARRSEGAMRGRPRAEVSSGRELLDRLTQEAEGRPREGVLLLIDEMGKFLEGAAADGSDIYFFQELAEAASRCKGRLVVVGILHQAFEQYAMRLGSGARDEWAKIQGRFIDIPLVAAVDEVIDLLGRAIVSDKRHPGTAETADKIARSIRSRRPGSTPDLGRRLDACWPLHPVTAAVLGPMSRRRFGQNERSVFGFLSSAEPGGFQEFIRNTQKSGELFGPERFWDYLRINLEPAILASNDSHRWAQAVDAVERCEARGSPLHVRLAKSIALVDMFRNGSGLAPDQVTIEACAPEFTKSDIQTALGELEKWSVAVFRKHLGAWASYAGSDFDIDGAVGAAVAQASELDLSRLAKLAGLQPVLAKRHHHQTGTLRWFQTDLVELAELQKGATQRGGDAAGHFLLAIPASNIGRKDALAVCRDASVSSATALIAVGLPGNASRIRDLGQELVALEFVRNSRPELDGDNVARREIAARVASVAADLEEEFRVGFSEADWFIGGERVELRSGSGLSQLASDLADKRFEGAPKIFSELLNRQRPSSNTQGGVRELIRAMMTSPEKEALGIEGFPIERGLYNTVLQPAGLHRDKGDGAFRFGKPSRSEIGKTFKPAWEAAERLVSADRNPVPIGRLYSEWSAPPFGIRRGVMPVLATAFIMANRHRLAIYLEGKFQADIDDYFADILLQDENMVALRGVDVDSFRGAVLNGIAAAIESTTGQSCPTEALELARHLVRLVRDLPAWTQKTLSLSAETIEVRRVLTLADDPHKALFEDLPTVFRANNAADTAAGIQTALRELTAAYSRMMDELDRKMLRALGHPDGGDLEDLRKRALVVSTLTGDLLMDAFADHLSNYRGRHSELEAIAGLVTRPTRDWSDRDPDQAALALADIALKFRRAEALAMVKRRKPTSEALAVVIGTGENGSAIFEEFEIAERDRPRVNALVGELAAVLSKSGAERNVVLAALAEAGFKAVNDDGLGLREVG